MFYLSRNQRELITSLAEVVCPPTPDPRSLAGTIAHATQQSIRTFPGPARLALLAGMRTYDNGARLYPPATGRPARALDREVAARYFDTWWRSPLGMQRSFAKGIKGIIALGFYELPEVKAAIGYTPEVWIESVKKRRLSIYKEEIDAHAARTIAPDPLGPFPLGGTE